ncbi:MAG: GGDEF and EAL domain-containing protein [Ruminococcus sp.]|nr:GGDEF and EAL domain-containing protein [Ruminococcus sp.]
MTNKGRIAKRIAAALTAALSLVAMAWMVSGIVRENLDSAKEILYAVAITGVGLAVAALCVIFYERSVRTSKELENQVKLMNKLTSMAIIWDTSFKYFKVNSEFIKATGYTEKDLNSFSVLRKVLPKDAFSDNLQSIINSRDEEFNIKCKNGGTVCTLWNTSILSSFTRRRNSITVMLSIGLDLTENHNMRQKLITYSEQLADSERKYSISMGLSEIGLLLKEKNSSRFYASEQLCKALGLVSDNGFVDSDDLRAAFHPKDKVIFDAFAQGKKNSSENLAENEIHSVDFRAMSADGEYHWYNFRFKALAEDEKGVEIGGAVMDITKDKEKDLVIEHMAYIDDVTGIYNRNKFMALGNELLQCLNSDAGVDYWVIVMDIDDFHIINDTCGYNTGDYLLKEIAAVISANLTEGGFNARIGGDNFALIIRAEDKNEQTPLSLLERIQADIALIGGMGLENQNISCSAGYCLMSDEKSSDFAQVLDRSEFALNLSDGSRSSVIRFDSHAHDKIIAGNEIERSLSKALDNNELVLYYQPKISLDDGSVMGMEALIRWVRPDGTVVPPSDFIPVAESSLLITKISRFVLFEACRQNKAWQDMGLAPVTVSVNLTAIDFYQTNVTESIQTALAETGLAPRWLDVELTESLALKDIDHAVSQMNEIKELGVKLSMDDFGTGYSSLSYIQILPITVLKLDRSFIMYLEEDEISREIVSAVIRIAKSKKIETIAEGIETPGQAEILKESGCDQAQGYFFGKPMPRDKFEEFLRSRQPKKPVAAKVTAKKKVVREAVTAEPASPEMSE